MHATERRRRDGAGAGKESGKATLDTEKGDVARPKTPRRLTETRKAKVDQKWRDKCKRRDLQKVAALHIVGQWVQRQAPQQSTAPPPLAYRCRTRRQWRRCAASSPRHAPQRASCVQLQHTGSGRTTCCGRSSNRPSSSRSKGSGSGSSSSSRRSSCHNSPPRRLQKPWTQSRMRCSTPWRPSGRRKDRRAGQSSRRRRAAAEMATPAVVTAGAAELQRAEPRVVCVQRVLLWGTFCQPASHILPPRSPCSHRRRYSDRTREPPPASLLPALPCITPAPMGAYFPCAASSPTHLEGLETYGRDHGRCVHGEVDGVRQPTGD